MNLKENTDSLIEKITKEAIEKMADKESIERLPKIVPKKDGATLEEIIFMKTEKQVNAMVENFEFKRRCGIDKNEIISKEETRDKIIKMYEKCIFFINLFENKNVIRNKCAEECRKDLRKQIKKMQKYKNLF